MSQITKEVRALVKEHNPERHEIIIKHWEDLEEETMFRWSSCIGSYMYRNPESNPFEYPPKELYACLRSFHHEKICPYRPNSEPCRF